MPDDRYRSILERADSHFGAVVAAQPANLQCRLGCTLCCHGLFEISAADVALIAHGLEQLSTDVLADIVTRAEAIAGDYPQPDLRDCSPAEKELFFKSTDSLPCPALGAAGECRIYDHRPLVCRTFGLPIRNGREFIGEECELNFTTASIDERERAAWDLEWEDVLGPEDEYTIPEAILLAMRVRK